MRKQFLFSLLILCSLSILGQTPELINYQAVIKGQDGETLINQAISLKASIIQNNASGNSIYSEVHQVETNQYGLVNLKIGEGEVTLGEFATIMWGADSYFLKIEVDITGGTSYTEIGTMQMVSVPYALYAKDVANKDDADADPANEIQTLSILNDQLSISEGNTITIPSEDVTNELQTLQINGENLEISDGNSVVLPDASDTNELQTLSLSNDQLELSNSNNVSLSNYLSPWNKSGENIYFNQGNVGIGKPQPTSKLEVKASPSSLDTDPLFQVINKYGDTVFAVFPDGVVVYIDDQNPKGNIGGFAVSGRTSSKGINNDYLRITPDSARVYVNNNVKGNIGGFAVSGRTSSKGEVPMFVSTLDSTRIYLNNNSSKGSIGGFAVSGRTSSKGGIEDYLNVSIDTNQIINPAEARILWYPTKEAFLTGYVLVESPDSVGKNSFASGYKSKAVGDFSQALGYESIARGKYSTAIGNYATASSSNSFAFGDSASAIGVGSFAIGSISRDTAGNPTNSPTKSLGEYSIALGLGANASGLGAMALGASNTANGDWSVAIGRESTATGRFSLAMGRESQALHIDGIAIGYKTKATSNDGCTAIGYIAESNGTRSIAVGRSVFAESVGAAAFGYNATAAGNYSLAINGTVQNTGWGACAIQGTSSGQKSIAIGNGSVSSSDHTIAIGTNSNSALTGAVAVGGNAKANAVYALAIGYNANAPVFSSTAVGTGANATSIYATAVGNSADAIGEWSTAVGRNTTASGNFSTCIGGEGNEAHDAYEVVLGRFAVKGTGDSLNWNSNDNLFVIGNGSADNSRHNTLTIKKDGKVFFHDMYGTPPSTSGRTQLYIDVFGQIGTSFSSERYKSNIKAINGIEWLYKLRPVNYTFKNDKNGALQYGLIAEEVEKINSDFVFYNKEGKLEGVSYDQLISPVIKALQEQNQKVEELDKINRELLKRIEELERKIK